MVGNVNNNDTRRSADTSRQGIGHRLLNWLFSVPVMLLFSLLLSIVIELIGVGFELWDEPGYLHALTMLREEASYLSNNFSETRYGQYFMSTAVVVVEQSNAVLANVLSVDSAGAPPSSLSIWDNMFYASAYIVKVFLLRLTVIVFNSPLFILTILVAATFGFVKRDLRRFGAGTEHVRRFLLFKKLIYPTVFLSYGIYLASPWTIHPIVVMLPSAFLLWVAIENAITFYQKDF